MGAEIHVSFVVAVESKRSTVVIEAPGEVAIACTLAQARELADLLSRTADAAEGAVAALERGTIKAQQSERHDTKTVRKYTPRHAKRRTVKRQGKLAHAEPVDAEPGALNVLSLVKSLHESEGMNHEQTEPGANAEPRAESETAA
jgi:non-homologous end joining protein Ku